MTNHGEELRRVLQEFFDRRARGESPSPREYLERHPHLRRELSEHFETVEALDRLVKGTGESPAEATVLGDFRIVREIGRGAFGRVFLAEQPSLANRKVALKVTVEGGGESQTLAQLQHTHIVPV
ncbi:MAG: serine/threonine protein kinase, partial [Planctomycetota bacterium]